MQSKSAGVSERIDLTDPTIETSKVIVGLLDIMIKDIHILDIPLISPDHTRHQVILFAQKYDFVNEIRTIKYQLNVALSKWDIKARFPRDIFLIASLLDEGTLCANAIKTAATWSWSGGCEPGQDKLFGDTIKGGKVFDLTGYSLSALRLMPIEVMWALLRASHKPNTLTSAALQADYDAMAEEFTRLMKLPGRSTYSFSSSG